MERRGRPKHPDILTPREWEVLALIRESRSNEEIAGRLGISIDGVKYHVSEILGKLGLENRWDAARWRPEAEQPRWLVAGAPLLFWRKLGFGWLSPALAGGVAIVVAAGVGLLVWALLATGGDGTTTAITTPLRLPGGDKIAYVLNGDIWVLDSDWERHRLTDDGNSFAPDWSPGGEWLRFDKSVGAGEALRIQPWLMRSDGSDARVFDAPSGLWSPDGEMLAYVAKGDREPTGALVTVSVESGEAYEILPSEFDVAGLAWSPDGRTIALTRSVPRIAEQPRSSPLNGLWLIDSTGGEPRQIVSREQLEAIFIQEGEHRHQFAGVDSLQWSPDGEHLAFYATWVGNSANVDGRYLFTVRRDGSGLMWHLLTYAGGFDWAPDRSALVLTAGSGRFVAEEIKRIALAEPGRPGVQMLTDPAERSDVSPVWSPRGDRIAFVASSAVAEGERSSTPYWMEGPTEGLWVMDADGKNLLQLTQNLQFTQDLRLTDRLPAWSADGSLLLYTRTAAGNPKPDEDDHDLQAPPELWLMRADGSERTRLVLKFDGMSAFAWYRALANP